MAEMKYEVETITDEHYCKKDRTFYFLVIWVGYKEPDWIPLRDVCHLQIWSDFVKEWRHRDWEKGESVLFKSCEECCQWSRGKITSVRKKRNANGRGLVSIKYNHNGVDYRKAKIAFGSSRLRHLYNESPHSNAIKSTTNQKDRRIRCRKIPSIHRNNKTKKYGKAQKSKSRMHSRKRCGKINQVNKHRGPKSKGVVLKSELMEHGNDHSTHPLCICGEVLIPTNCTVYGLHIAVTCDICNVQCKEGDIIWHCLKEQHAVEHVEGFDLCEKCASKQMM